MVPLPCSIETPGDSDFFGFLSERSSEGWSRFPRGGRIPARFLASVRRKGSIQDSGRPGLRAGVSGFPQARRQNIFTWDSMTYRRIARFEPQFRHEEHTMDGGELECVAFVRLSGELGFCCQHAHCQELRSWKGTSMRARRIRWRPKPERRS